MYLKHICILLVPIVFNYQWHSAIADKLYNNKKYIYILLGHHNNLRVLYCQSKPSAPKAKSTRYIPQAEDRILDAPDLLDDYCESSSCLIFQFAS